jgi:hypothetical protein
MRKIELERPLFTAPGVELIEKSFPEATEILAGHLVGQEYWVVICDGFGLPPILSVMRRFYSDDVSEADRFGIIVPYQGALFGVFVLRRRLMTADKYQFELKKAGVNKSRRELVETAALIRVGFWNRQRAHELAAALGLEIVGDDLAMEE